MNRYTGDVVVMGLMTDSVDDAVEWMLEDCPKTPKIVIADAEVSSDPAHTWRYNFYMDMQSSMRLENDDFGSLIHALI